MHRVIYLVALEKIFGNAIFDNQVKKLLLRIKRKSGENLELTLVSFLPWIEVTRRGIYSNFRRHRREIDSLKKELEQEGIRLVTVRSPMPSAFFHMGPLGLIWFSLCALPALLYQILTRRVQVVHCRYYYATFTALLAAKLIRRQVKVIFDVRTLLPEQGIVNGTWGLNGLSFRFWKAVEGWMFASAHRVMAVSPAMNVRIKGQYPAVPVETIPNFVDLELFRPIPRLRREKRRELGIEQRKVLVYSGTLGGRYPAERIAGCVRTFFRVFGEQSYFLLLTSSDEKRLAPLGAALSGLGLERTRAWQAVGTTPAEVPEYLNAADWAILVLGDFLSCETFLPLKFAEYLAVGLPILTHPANWELVKLVKKYRVGAVLDEREDPERLRRYLEENESSLREHCRPTAREEFDINRYAARYADIYNELVGKQPQ